MHVFLFYTASIWCEWWWANSWKLRTIPFEIKPLKKILYISLLQYFNVKLLRFTISLEITSESGVFVICINKLDSNWNPTCLLDIIHALSLWNLISWNLASDKKYSFISDVFPMGYFNACCYDWIPWHFYEWIATQRKQQWHKENKQMRWFSVLCVIAY